MATAPGPACERRDSEAEARGTGDAAGSTWPRPKRRTWRQPRTLLDGLGPNAKYTLLPDDVMTEIVIQDGSSLSAEDIALFGRLTDLETLQILNYRDLERRNGRATGGAEEPEDAGADQLGHRRLRPSR